MHTTSAIEIARQDSEKSRHTRRAHRVDLAAARALCHRARAACAAASAVRQV